jgi:dephospho-CoA kinase
VLVGLVVIAVLVVLTSCRDRNTVRADHCWTGRVALPAEEAGGVNVQLVEIIEWQPDWAKDFDVLAASIREAAGSSVVRVDHIGSTSVPGMAAKDCIDVQAIVRSLSDEQLTEGLLSAGFTRSPGAWEGRDHIPEGWTGDPAAWDKLVFRPPADTRTGNVHVRLAGSLNERYALLFRDFLTNDQAAREGWAEFKRRLARAVPTDLPKYGDVKTPATDVLMAAAERWARETGWTPPQSVSAAPAIPRD